MKYILILLLLVSCNARKSEVDKKTESASEIQRVNVVNSDWSKVFDINKSFDKGTIYVREFSETGALKKETITQNNKSNESLKSKEQLIKNNITAYKSATIYKTLKIKKTQKEAVSNWVYVSIVLFLIVLYQKFKDKVWWW